MITTVKVRIVCSKEDLSNYGAFLRCAEFGYFDSVIELFCKETSQTKTYQCMSTRANCYGWLHFKDEWERQFGKVN